MLQRFNVAITRAKALLIVIGNPKVLQIDGCWREFIEYCQKNGACVGDEFTLSEMSTTEKEELLHNRLETKHRDTENSLPINEEEILGTRVHPLPENNFPERERRLPKVKTEKIERDGELISPFSVNRNLEAGKQINLNELSLKVFNFQFTSNVELFLIRLIWKIGNNLDIFFKINFMFVNMYLINSYSHFLDSGIYSSSNNSITIEERFDVSMNLGDEVAENSGSLEGTKRLEIDDRSNISSFSSYSSTFSNFSDELDKQEVFALAKEVDQMNLTAD